MRSRILQIRGGLIGPYSLAEFRRCGFADVIFGPAIRLAIRVKRPETEHTVSVGTLQSWFPARFRTVALMLRMRHEH